MASACVEQVAPREVQPAQKLVHAVLQKHLQVERPRTELLQCARPADLVDEVLDAAQVARPQQKHRIVVMPRGRLRIEKRRAIVGRARSAKVVVKAGRQSGGRFRMVEQRYVHELRPVRRRRNASALRFKKVEKRPYALFRSGSAGQLRPNGLADGIVVLVFHHVVVPVPA